MYAHVRMHARQDGAAEIGRPAAGPQHLENEMALRIDSILGRPAATAQPAGTAVREMARCVDSVTAAQPTLFTTPGRAGDPGPMFPQNIDPARTVKATHIPKLNLPSNVPLASTRLDDDVPGVRRGHKEGTVTQKMGAQAVDVWLEEWGTADEGHSRNVSAGRHTPCTGRTKFVVEEGGTIVPNRPNGLIVGVYPEEDPFSDESAHTPRHGTITGLSSDESRRLNENRYGMYV